MSVIYIALPIAIGLGASALIACLYCIREGQFEDLESPPLRMLLDEQPKDRTIRTEEEKTAGPHHGSASP